MRWLVLVVLFLAGCPDPYSVGATRHASGDGVHVDISCEYDDSKCRDKAREECPGGYSILDKNRSGDSYSYEVVCRN